MSLAVGTKLGSFAIEAPIGAGGMGEVYRARDTRLDRAVAIKVLPAHLSENEHLRERFDREARAISSLNHPHICTLHDVGREDGIDFLVMEYLEGETLADRLKRGALALRDALDVARQIARALDAAHRQGVVHRDLKPGNVMLTKAGVKLLDFGLAKTTESNATDLSAAPTAQKPLTEEGAILGTFQYMAPEQLEGGEVGRGADIFAFGAMLYEMVTGEKAFTGKSQASLIAAILEREPKPVSEVKPTSPASLDRVIQSCLQKDPDERWESARDLERELRWIETEPEIRAAEKSRKRVTPWLVVGGVSVALLLAALLVDRSSREPRAPTRVTVNLPDGLRLRLGEGAPFALSLDGRRLVFVAESDETESQLYFRELTSFVSTPIPGTEGATTPFFAPDGESVGFWSDNELKKIALAGGPPTVLAPWRSSGGAIWARDGFIYYNQTMGQGYPLMRVSARGGTPEPVSASLVVPPQNPQMLPDGKTLLVRGDKTTGGAEVGLLTIGTDEIRPVDSLVEGSGGAIYVPPGFLLIEAAGGSILGARFDAGNNVLDGQPVPVISEPVLGGVGRDLPFLRVSDNGTLAYVRGEEGSLARQVVRVDRTGRATPVANVVAHAPRLSPDGRRLAFDQEDVWIYNLEREALRRLTTDGLGGMVVWSPDGARIAFQLDKDVVSMPWDGAEQRELLLQNEFPSAAESFSPDGRYLALTEVHPELGLNIVVAEIAGPARIDFASTPAAENGPQFSPDGRFIAYVSDESGEREVYARPFPVASARWQISTAGGTAPVWSQTGAELFYRAGSAMMTVPVDLTAEDPFGRPSELFDGDFLIDNSGHAGYAVDASGETFYLSARRYDVPRTQIQLVLNWLDELERLIPEE